MPRMARGGALSRYGPPAARSRRARAHPGAAPAKLVDIAADHRCLISPGRTELEKRPALIGTSRSSAGRLYVARMPLSAALARLSYRAAPPKRRSEGLCDPHARRRGHGGPPPSFFIRPDSPLRVQTAPCPNTGQAHSRRHTLSSLKIGSRASFLKRQSLFDEVDVLGRGNMEVSV